MNFAMSFPIIQQNLLKLSNRHASICSIVSLLSVKMLDADLAMLDLDLAMLDLDLAKTSIGLPILNLHESLGLRTLTLRAEILSF